MKSRFWMTISLITSIVLAHVSCANAQNSSIENLAKRAVPYLMSNSGVSLEPSESNIADYAIDDSLKTAAIAGGEWAWTLLLDLNKEESVGSVVLTFPEDSYPINYTISTTQDGKQWQEVVVVTNNQQGGVYRHDFSPCRAKQIKIRDDLAQVGVRQMAIANVEVYAGVEGKTAKNIIAKEGWSAQAYSVHPDFSQYTPSFGIDGNPNDYWLSESAQQAENGEHERWFKVDLGKEQTINQITMDCNRASNAPREMDILISKDDVKYQTVAHYSGTGVDRAFTVSFQAEKGRYIKFVLTNPQELLPDVWYIADINCFNSEQAEDTSFYKVEGEEKTEINRLCNGTIQLERIVASEENQSGWMITALYEKGTNRLVSADAVEMTEMDRNLKKYQMEFVIDSTDAILEEEPNNELACTSFVTYQTPEGTYLADATTQSQIAAKAVDGDWNTAASPSGRWAWNLQLDLQQITTVGYVDFTFPEDHYSKKYTIETSENGSHWTEVIRVMDNTNAGTFEYTFQPVQARYIRLRQLESDAELTEDLRQMAISEFRVYKRKPEKNQYELRTFLWNKQMVPLGKVDIID